MMHALIYRDGMSGVLSGAGEPAPYTADGSELIYYGRPTSQAAVDLSGMGEVRLSCNAWGLTGDAGSVTLSLEYMTGGEWHSAAASVTVTGQGLHVGSWVTLPPGCDDAILRLVTSDETDNGGAQIQPLAVTIDARP